MSSEGQTSKVDSSAFALDSDFWFLCCIVDIVLFLTLGNKGFTGWFIFE